jgi:hypothetical protein
VKRTLLLILALAFTPSLAHAQTLSMRGITLTPIEQGIDDADPLAVSLRVLRPDYRLSTNFERIYEARLDPRVFGPQLAANADQTFLVRFAGGVAAVFPKSEYVKYRGLNYAKVPPGTVFSIGGPIERLMGEPNFDSLPKLDAAPSAQFVNRSARLPAPDSTSASTATASARNSTSEPQLRLARPTERSIFADEVYRHDRLDALTTQAINQRKTQQPR